MTVELLFLILLSLLVFAGVLSGLPVMAVLMAVPLLVSFIAAVAGVFDLQILGALPARLFGIMSNQTLFAIPLFVLMGVILERSGAGHAMLSAFARFSGATGRGLLLSVLAMSAILAATTGVVGASVVMLAMVALPGLVRHGISRSLASGLVCAGGTLGQIMPPSILIIILADQISSAYMAGRREAGDFAPVPVSVGDLFAAAMLPALLLVALYAIYLWWVTGGKRGQALERQEPFDAGTGKPAEAREGRLLWAFAPIALVIVVLGSILFGLATTNEAAAFGVLGALLLAFGMDGRSRGLSGLALSSLKETVLMTGMIFGIIFGATTLALVIRGLGGDGFVAHLMSLMPGGETGLLIGVLLIVFLLGFVLEFIEIILIVVPLAGPVLFAGSADPVWVAILLSLVLQTSFLTPPFGLALFYFQGASQRSGLGIATGELYRGIFPFVLLQGIAVGMVFVFPQLATGIKLWLN